MPALLDAICNKQAKGCACRAIDPKLSLTKNRPPFFKQFFPCKVHSAGLSLNNLCTPMISWRSFGFRKDFHNLLWKRVFLIKYILLGDVLDLQRSCGFHKNPAIFSERVLITKCIVSGCPLTPPLSLATAGPVTISSTRFVYSQTVPKAGSLRKVSLCMCVRTGLSWPLLADNLHWRLTDAKLQHSWKLDHTEPGQDIAWWEVSTGN